MHYQANQHQRHTAWRSRQQGQALVEYALIMTLVGVVLFVPQSLTNNMSVAEYIARAVAAFFKAYSVLVSVF